MAERWHTFVTDAIRTSHEFFGFKFLKPCQVYFRLRDDRCVLYKPDAILLRPRGGGYRAVIIEAETNPTAKLVPGDLFLSSLIGWRLAEMYPYKRLGLGRTFRNDKVFRDSYDRRYIRQVIYAEERNIITGDDIGTLDFILFTEGEENRDYLQAYLDLFLSGSYGHGRPFSNWECISVGRRSRGDVVRKMNRVLRGLNYALR